ncbi:Uncharacterised protein [Vibrio cholerae]|nr:Uncharacterised protein [Vibrio cholerae]
MPIRLSLGFPPPMKGANPPLWRVNLALAATRSRPKPKLSSGLTR